MGHGTFASSLRETTTLFLGESRQLAAVDLATDQGPDAFSAELAKTAAEVNKGDGVLILADLFGGTPANTAWKLVTEDSHCTAVAGVNLPMLMEVLMAREGGDDLRKLTEMATSSGKQAIQELTPLVDSAERGGET